ncbi:hypothetical protein CRYUN_Cryun39dG0077000 [Craigia yunnanensis]
MRCISLASNLYSNRRDQARQEQDKSYYEELDTMEEMLEQPDVDKIIEAFNRHNNPSLESAVEDLSEEEEPQLVSIGPYHKGKNLSLEKYKYLFLEKFMFRTRNQGKDLCFYVRHMMTLEWRTRRCYAEDLPMSSSEFVEIMLVDGCFIMEVLRHFGRSEESEDGFFPIEPWQIPVMVQDLLMQ